MLEEQGNVTRVLIRDGYTRHLMWLLFSAAAVLSAGGAEAQVLGANYNERPRDVDASLLTASRTPWVRGFFDMFNLEGTSNLSSNVNVAGMRRAADAGQELLLSFKWAFDRENESVPAPGSPREAELFQLAFDSIQAIDRPISSLVLGNEPMWETRTADLEFVNGSVPYVAFTERLLDHLQSEFESQELPQPRYYLGSLNRLDQTANRNKDVVQELLRVSRENPSIAGLDVHIHFDTEQQARSMLNYARQQLGTQKELLVTEFSPVWKYQNAFDDSIGATAAGMQFAQQYGYSPSMRVDDYLTAAYDDQVSRQEWTDFIISQPWYNEDHLDDMQSLFREFNVSIATLGFSQPLSFRGTNASSGSYVPYHINWLYIIGLIEGDDLLEAYNEPYMEDWLHSQNALADVQADGAVNLHDLHLIQGNLGLNTSALTSAQAVRAGDVNLDRTVDADDLARFAVLFEAIHGVPVYLVDPADIDRNGEIDAADWTVLLNNMTRDLSAAGIDPTLWMANGDLNQSGIVDRNDFRQFKLAYETLNGSGSFATLTAVPEPTALHLGVVIVLALALTQRHCLQCERRD